MEKPRSFVLPFLGKEQLAKDTYAFHFDSSSIDLSFLPGQYIRIVLPHESADYRGTSRFFTIASSPFEKERVTIITRVIQSSFKKALFYLEKGTEVSFFGPNGKMVLDESEKSGYVFLAGSLGITPFLSMISYMIEKKLKTPVYLFATFQTVEDVFWKEKLEEISLIHPQIHTIYTITQSEVSKTTWDGEVGRVSEILLKRYLPDMSTPIYYIVGKPEMVDTTRGMLVELGMKEERIRQEYFSDY